MSDTIYRTLVRGTLVQQSALCVGGSAATPGGPDIQCARDGRGWPTIPGTGLAGALIETASRLFPKLFDENAGLNADWNRITGKGRKPPPVEGRNEPEHLRQSLWHFWPAHLSATTASEARQGVGIRQQTGATASEARALFDVEVIPAGHRWDLFFEIDTRRGGPLVESIALLALWEWTQGRCWLGASAARGLGWMELEGVEVLRLKLTLDAVNAWPDCTRPRGEVWRDEPPLGTLHRGAKELHTLGMTLVNGQLPDEKERYRYLTLDAVVTAGPTADGYGRDSLSVGGHAAGSLSPLSAELIAPQGVTEEHFRGKYRPDTPIVTTAGVGADGKTTERPALPGSGIRGPLRHRASAWSRGQEQDDRIIDPNDPGRRLGDSNDPISVLFGLTTRSGRLLVRDGELRDAFRLVCLQHHAEDEFTGGVYGSGKFDRTALLDGSFAVRLVIEAGPDDDLVALCATLKPALRLAELGQLALGGGKWRGHGWLPWRFESVQLCRAGDSKGTTMKVGPNVSVVEVLTLLGLDKKEGQS